MQPLNKNSSRTPKRRSEEEKKTLINQWKYSHQTISSFGKERCMVHSLF